MMRWAALTLFLLAPTIASAQDGADSMDAEAHALYEAGATAFRGGRYDDALQDFQRAYDLSHRPGLLYNIGQCHDRLRHDVEALAAFEQYVQEMPDAPQRPEIEGRLPALREAAERERAAREAAQTQETPTVTEPPPAEPTPPPPPAAHHDPDVTPWIVAGAGGVVAIVGAILVGVAYGDIGTVQNAAMGTFYDSVMSADQQAPILSGVGFAAIGVGLAAAAAGIVWGIVGSSPSSESVAVRIGPGGVSIAGTF
jgi:tetratricopeptide (TPR) repeat protein